MTALVLISPSPLEQRRFFDFIQRDVSKTNVTLFYERSVLWCPAIDKILDKENIIVVVNGNRLPDLLVVRISILLKFDVLILQHGVHLSTPLSKKFLFKLTKQYRKYARWVFGTITAIIWLAIIKARQLHYQYPNKMKRKGLHLAVWAYTEEYLSYWRAKIPTATGILLPAPNPITYGALNDVGSHGVNLTSDVAIFVDELYEETYGLDHRPIFIEAVQHAASLNLELMVKLHPRSSPRKYSDVTKKQALVNIMPEGVAAIYGYESSLFNIANCDSKFKWDPESKKYNSYHYDVVSQEGDYESSVLESLNAI